MAVKSRKVQKQLDNLKAFFKSGATNEEKMALWNILSALRGPDADAVDLGMENVKDITTNVIRYAVFGKTIIPRTTIRANADSRIFRENRPGIERGHFRWHAHKAFDALGLKWSDGDAREPEEG